jgi:hypothetical protein
LNPNGQGETESQRNARIVAAAVEANVVSRKQIPDGWADGWLDTRREAIRAAAAAATGELQAQFDAAQKKGQEMNTSKLGPPVPGAEEENRPRCKKHRKFMKYNAAEDQMECVEPDCTQVARRKRSFKNALGADLDGNPVSYRGALEFVTDVDGRLYLHLIDANAVVLIDGVQGARPFKQDPKATEASTRFMETVSRHIPSAAVAARSLKQRLTRDKELDEMTRRQKARFEHQQRLQRGYEYPAIADGVLPPRGSMKINGVTLPPHYVNISQIVEIQKVVNRLHKTVTLGDSRPSAEYIALAIAETTEEVDDFGGLTLRYFSAWGAEIDEVQKEPGSWKSEPRVVMDLMLTKLDELDRLNASEAPHYVMFGGKAWTRQMVKKTILNLESASRSIVTKDGITYSPRVEDIEKIEKIKQGLHQWTRARSNMDID